MLKKGNELGRFWLSFFLFAEITNRYGVRGAKSIQSSGG